MDGKNFFLVGTMYGGEDEQLGKWVHEKIWRLGWNNREKEQAYLNMKKIWDDFELGDILIAKSKVIRPGYSGIKVKGVAKVISKKSDNHTVNVEWLTLLDKSDYVEFKVPSPTTISRLSEKLGVDIVEKVLLINKDK